MKSRLALIGPILPWRGGVARHTTMLRRALAERDVLAATLSFRRLYPRWLFPGRFLTEPGCEDYAEPGTAYSLDTLRPATWRRAAAAVDDSGAAAVVFPWWTVVLAPLWLSLARAFRRGGRRVVFLCHNLVDHEAGRVKTALARHVLGQGHAFVTHTESEAGKLRTWFPGRPVSVYPHPVFEDFPAPTVQLPRRAALEVLFFGIVRRYKGLDVLADAMAQLVGEDVVLTVAGEWWMSDAALRRRLTRDPLKAQVELIDRYVSDHEAAGLFSRADVIVLPYRRATGSGVATLAARYGKPVIAADTAGLRDRPGAAASLFAINDAGALAARLREHAARTQPAEVPACDATWAGLAECVIAAAGRDGGPVSMSDPPGVSVLVSTRDRPASLVRMLASLAGQTYPRQAVELIVVNDGLCAETAALCREHAGQFGDLRVLSPERAPAGLAAGRNLAVGSARHDRLLFIDDDCVADREWVARMVAALDEAPVVAGAVRDAPGGLRRSIHNVAQFHQFMPGRPPADVDFVAGANMGFRRSVFDEIGLFDVSIPLAEDTDMALRARSRGMRIRFEPAAVVTHDTLRCTWRDLLTYSYTHARVTIRLRTRHREILRTSWVLRHRVALTLLAPLIALGRTILIYQENPAQLRRLHTAPAVWLLKLAWCLGAARGLSDDGESGCA